MAAGVVLMGVLVTKRRHRLTRPRTLGGRMWSEVRDKRQKKQIKMRRQKVRKAEEKNRMVVENSAKKGLGECFC